MKQSVTDLPFNSFLGIEIAAEAPRLLRLPAGPQYLNHLGTVHASAQLALAEASSGEFLLRTLGSASGVVPIVRRLESKFRKPAHGAVTSIVSARPETLEQLHADLAAKGRALITSILTVFKRRGYFSCGDDRCEEASWRDALVASVGRPRRARRFRATLHCVVGSAFPLRHRFFRVIPSVPHLHLATAELRCQ